MNIIFFLTAPSSAPVNVTAESFSGTMLSVEWEGIPRRDVNGEPLGYKINVCFTFTCLHKILELKEHSLTFRPRVTHFGV